MSENDVRCGEREASCSCSLLAAHDGPHLCECEGSWYRDDEGRFHVVAFPNRVLPGSLLNGILDAQKQDEEEAA